MGRRTTHRLALAATGLLALAACVVNLSFDMDQAGVLVQTALAGSVPSQSVLIDLGTYPDVRAHQKDIRSLDLEYVDVTITDIKAATNQAKVLGLTLALRKNMSDPPAQDLKIGDVQSFQVIPQGRQRIPGNPELDTFLLDRLHDGGKFYLVISGTTDGRTDIVLDVNLHASMAYDTGLF